MRSHLVLLGAILVGIGLNTAEGCCTTVPPAAPRTQDAQVAAAVDISELCIYLGNTPPYQAYEGTGVAVSPTRVLTAAHLTTCKVQGLYLELPDGSAAHAGILWMDRVRDIAMLTVPEGTLGSAAAPAIAAPVVGEPVCARVAHPRASFVCGTVLAVGADQAAFDASIHPGNSGGGVYDRTGHLLGVVSKYTKAGGTFAIVKPADVASSY